MSYEINSSYNDTSSASSEIAIPYIVRFWIILPFYVPSVICSLFVVYNCITNRSLRRAVHHHVICLLIFVNLITELTSIPWSLNYYRLGVVWPQNIFFCLSWTFCDEALYVTTTILLAWATIERHILIFHDRLISTKWKRFCFHITPILLLILYCIFFNAFVILAPPCTNTFDYTTYLCGSPLCYYENQAVGMWDVIVHDFIPTVVIIFCNIALLLRVVYQKYRMRRPIRWRNHRRMTIQLVSISLLYLVIYIPRMLMEFIYRCGVSEDVGADFMKYAEFIAVYGNLLLPFVCAGCMPELRANIRLILRLGQQETKVVPVRTFVLSRYVDGPPLKTVVHVY